MIFLIAFLCLHFCASTLYPSEHILASYYAPIRESITAHNSRRLLQCSEEIEKSIKKNSRIEESTLQTFSDRACLNEHEKIFLHETFACERLTTQNLVGFLFYPYHQLRSSTKTNFNQLSLTMKLSILLAAKYGFEPAQFLIFTSHIGTSDNDSRRVADGLLSLPFCLDDFSSLQDLKSIFSKRDNSSWILEKARSSYDPIYLTNSSLLFRQMELPDIAEELAGKTNLTDWQAACTQRIEKILTTPFSLENRTILNCLKNFAYQATNYTFLFERANTSSNSLYVINASFFFRMFGHLSDAERLLMRAESLHSQRLGMDFLLLNFSKDSGSEASFSNLSPTDPLGLEAYAHWKIAQCYRYGRKTPRDLARANTHYLQAVSISMSNPSKRLPEIHFDAGDFALYCALSHPNPLQKNLALESAIQHFKAAQIFGMEEAFSREDEATSIHPELNSPNNFNTIAEHATTAGYLKVALEILRRHDLPLPNSLTWATAEKVDITFTKLYRNEKW